MLRSGNGRHRRPRQTPKFIVTAGVTGAGVAIPLMGATSASATPGTTWDKVAACESNATWSANTGNGYFGGLQITENNWAAFGGKDYAPRPDLASRLEQIAVAEKILSVQGPMAWASCAAEAGLPGAGVPTPEPGPVTPPTSTAPTTPSPEEPADPAGDQGESAKPTPSPTTTPGATPAPEEDASAEPTPTPSRSTPAAEQETETATPGPSTSAPTSPERETRGPRHAAPETSTPETSTPERASRGAGKHRAVTVAQERDERVYTVRLGDTLSAIAAEHDYPGGWHRLYEANQDTVGDDPDLILPDQRLEL